MRPSVRTTMLLTVSTRCNHGWSTPPITVMSEKDIEIGAEVLFSVAVLIEIPPPAFPMNEQDSKDMFTSR